jgi:hypothetical protein
MPEVVTDRKSGLPAADDEDVIPLTVIAVAGPRARWLIRHFVP